MQPSELVDIASPTDPCASVEHPAVQLMCSTDSVFRWLDRRSLPGLRVGRVWRFEIYAVNAWFRAYGATENAGKAAS